jgi:hypothetical protein
MQYGYWKVLVIKKHRLPASFRHLVPGIFVGCLALSATLGFFWPPALWVAFGLGTLYLLAALMLSLVIAGGSHWTFLPVLPLVVGCFHFGYGYGFLRGLLDLVLFRNAPDTQFVRLTRESAPNPDRIPA